MNTEELERILNRYREAKARGKTLSPHHLCRGRKHLLPLVREALRKLREAAHGEKWIADVLEEDGETPENVEGANLFPFRTRNRGRRHRTRR